MRLYLAPMDGVLDYYLREVLTNIGGIDACVTEFIRVNDLPVSDKTFHRICPELNNNCKTTNQTPVNIQLLGSNPQTVAQSAIRAIELGANSIDLNFGCPAKTVNKSSGGAILLKTPNLIYSIVKSVRDISPKHIEVTAKIRLGFENKNLYMENAKAVEDGGANKLFVHARSKLDGYKPPAYWEYITRIRDTISIPVVANGEIWSVADWEKCKLITGCDEFMIGRGAIATPDLAMQIKSKNNQTEYKPLQWLQIVPMIYNLYVNSINNYKEKYIGNRIKQWVFYLSRTYPEALLFFDMVKKLKTKSEFNKFWDSILVK